MTRAEAPLDAFEIIFWHFVKFYGLFFFPEQ
jgi:hypothetical protein